MAAKPQLDDAIAYLQAEIAALRAGERDDKLVTLAVAAAAGDLPLPEPQFAPLLSLWTPKGSSFPSDLGALVDEYEAARRVEETEDKQERRESDGKRHVESALEHVRGQRRRPRTRPRRRFEDIDERDARQDVGDGLPVVSPREDTGTTVGAAAAAAGEGGAVGAVKKDEEGGKIEEEVKMGEDVDGQDEMNREGETRGQEKTKEVEEVKEVKEEVERDAEVKERNDVAAKGVAKEEVEEDRREVEQQEKANGEEKKEETGEKHVEEVEKLEEVKDEKEEEREEEEAKEETNEREEKATELEVMVEDAEERPKEEEMEDVKAEEMNDVVMKEGQDDEVEKTVAEGGKSMGEQKLAEDDKSMEEKKVVGEEKVLVEEEKGEKKVVVVGEEESSAKEQIVVDERKSKKEEAKAALASLKVLRRNMLLDVLSKIVSVAKSKDVDPAMFTKKVGDDQMDVTHQVDLEKIQAFVASGVICEWAQFAEQVYLFCQHVVTDAERHERLEARRKGVELLHFARTLTETLRKASIKKEDVLLQKIREAEEEATARKERDEVACKKEAKHTHKAEEAVSGETSHRAVEDTTDMNDSDGKTLAGEFLDLRLLSPTRASTRIRKRTSVTSDGPGSAAPSPSSQKTRKRIRGASVSAASASEEVSASESHDASASEADPKSRRPHNTSKTPARRTPARRRRPLMPATRISSRQQKRRAVAAAAAAAATSATSAGSGNEEGNSGGEALSLVLEREGNDAAVEQNAEEMKIEGDVEQKQDEEEPSTPKKKNTAPRSRGRKKGGRKR